MEVGASGPLYKALGLGLGSTGDDKKPDTNPHGGVPGGFGGDLKPQVSKNPMIKKEQNDPAVKKEGDDEL